MRGRRVRETIRIRYTGEIEEGRVKYRKGRVEGGRRGRKTIGISHMGGIAEGRSSTDRVGVRGRRGRKTIWISYTGEIAEGTERMCVSAQTDIARNTDIKVCNEHTQTLALSVAATRRVSGGFQTEVMRSQLPLWPTLPPKPSPLRHRAGKIVSPRWSLGTSLYLEGGGAEQQRNCRPCPQTCRILRAPERTPANRGFQMHLHPQDDTWRPGACWLHSSLSH